MSKKDLFVALIKLIGFYTFFTYLVSLLNTVFYTIVQDEVSLSEQKIEIGYYLIFMGSSLVLMLFTEKIVGVFRLNKGYERDFIALDNMKSIDVVKVGVFIIGALYLLANIPFILVWLIQRFSTNVSGINITLYDDYSFYTAVIKMVFGYLMLTNFSRIAKWFVKWNKERDEN
ncbi:MAG: hypothetical protein LBI73_13660 [Myroides sp.]|jgi:hypothetical protein|nr:hypothetical protein [Myroides sp.]